MKKIAVTLEVANQVQAQELNEAWAEIISGQKLERAEALDTHLANACLDYLNYDRLGKREVHHHLAGGDGDLNRWIEDIGLDPALHLDQPQAEAFAKLPEQARRDRHELLQDAIDDLLDKYRRKASERKR
jgi:hypothetical protein